MLGGVYSTVMPRTKFIYRAAQTVGSRQEAVGRRQEAVGVGSGQWAVENEKCEMRNGKLIFQLSFSISHLPLKSISHRPPLVLVPLVSCRYSCRLPPAATVCLLPTALALSHEPEPFRREYSGCSRLPGMTRADRYKLDAPIASACESSL